MKLTAFQIKVIMTVLMTLDHLAPLLPYTLARAFHIASRPVAVWFAFAAVESLGHTRSRRDYLTRLYGGAAVMQAGNLALGFLMRAKPDLVPDNNILLTLALGASVICLLEGEGRVLLRWAAMAAAGAYMVAFTEGGLVVLATMLICWALQESPGLRSLSLAMAYLLLAGAPVGYPSLGMIAAEFFGSTTAACVGVLPFLHLYSGELGRGGWRGFFYVYYPAHIWAIAALAYAVL